MRFDWWTFGFQVLNLLVLLWLLGHFLFRPVARIIAEREAQTAEEMDTAGAARRGAEEAKAAAEAERESAAAERAAALDAARAEAEKLRASLVDKARTEARAIVQEARARAGTISAEGRKEELRRAGALAVSICRRLMDSLPRDARVAGYDRRLAEALDQLDPEERRAIAADGTALRLLAPRPLDEEESEAARAALRSLAPEGPVAIAVAPELIAGLELQGPHGVVHNSLRADLDRIAEALESDEHG